MISGFSFIHNAISSGYPIVEAIRAVRPYVDEICIVDMESTDGTRDLLESLPSAETPIKIFDGRWGFEAGETLRQAHNQYVQCAGDMIIHFEADEVYDDSLIKSVVSHVKAGHDSIAVYRLQLEANFQRCRWYPEPVHRVFSRTSGARKDGHTTNQHMAAFTLEPKNGYLWDITNCFRDNWFSRVEKQAQLRQSEPQYLITPIHTLHRSELAEHEARKIVYSANYWKWTNTPFNIPDVLKHLVGMVKYAP